MFPGIDGFHWTPGHVLFLSLFFAVALTILVTVVSAAWRTIRDFRSERAIDLWWRSQFAELPVSDRRCRHELAGRVLSRTCDNATIARNIPSSPCCLRPGTLALSASITRMIATTIAGTPG